MIRRENVEQMISESKELRELYGILNQYGKYLHMDWEGKVETLGDAVIIRPTHKSFSGLPASRNLLIDIVVPSKNRVQYILNVINWEVESDVVLVFVNHMLYMGYQEVV